MALSFLVTLAITLSADIITGIAIVTQHTHRMQIGRALLIVLLTLSLSLQVAVAGVDTACHHEHMTQTAMADMQHDCGDDDMAAQPPCCDNDCQCDSHLLHTSAFIADDSELTVRLKPVLARFNAIPAQVRQPHFPHYRPPRHA